MRAVVMVALRGAGAAVFAAARLLVCFAFDLVDMTHSVTELGGRQEAFAGQWAVSFVKITLV